jgi:hypothetical protein
LRTQKLNEIFSKSVQPQNYEIWSFVLWKWKLKVEIESGNWKFKSENCK